MGGTGMVLDGVVLAASWWSDLSPWSRLDMCVYTGGGSKK
jgi:hypothetical protein